MSAKIQKEVTERILNELKSGVCPWRKPWKDAKGFGGMPANAITNRAYSGINIFLLWQAAANKNYAAPLWLTYKQAQNIGGNVMKGEKGTQIIFVSHFDKRNEDTGKLEKIPFLKWFTVFNIEQCENIKVLTVAKPELPQVKRDELIDEFVKASGATVQIKGNRAVYIPSLDVINMPAIEQFDNADAFYSTQFHEMTHWTAHEKRLNRVCGKRFGDQAYSAEELVAELGAAFLCAEFGVNNEGQDSAYIASWIKFLTDHENAIIFAASAASKAVDFLRSKALEETTEIEAESEAA